MRDRARAHLHRKGFPHSASTLCQGRVVPVTLRAPPNTFGPGSPALSPSQPRRALAVAYRFRRVRDRARAEGGCFPLGLAPRPASSVRRHRDGSMLLGVLHGACSSHMPVLRMGRAPTHTPGNGDTLSLPQSLGSPGDIGGPLPVAGAPPPGWPAITGSQKFEMGTTGHGGLAAARTPRQGCPCTARLPLRWARHRKGGVPQCVDDGGWLT